MIRHPLHLSLRVKLGVAFAGAMAILLAALGLFIYARFQAGLDRSVNESLRARATDVRVLNAQADTGLADSRQVFTNNATAGFAQVLRRDGTVLDSTPGLARSSQLSPAQLRHATQAPMFIDRGGTGSSAVRLFVTPSVTQDQSPVLVLVGTSLHERNAALRELATLMLLGGPVALLLATVLGYAVAALSLRSVETLRRRASELSVTKPGERLPVPSAADELQRLAVTLNQMLERNEAAFARERRFVADASHELRTPLSVLKAELEVALTGPTSTRELRDALASADAEADRVIRLAQDLLSLAQADHGALPLELTDVSMSALLDTVAARFAARGAAAGRTVMAGGAEGMSIRADAAQLEQALSALTDNALTHGAGAVRLSATRRGATVELHVEDEGPGFAREFLPIAFERFSRADRARTSEGTGLGLAIVRSIARAHGGEVHASERGHGDVWLELPTDRFAVPPKGGPTSSNSVAPTSPDQPAVHA